MAISKTLREVSSGPTGSLELIFSRTVISNYFTATNSDSIDFSFLADRSYIVEIRTSEALQNSLTILNVPRQDVFTLPISTSTTNSFFLDELRGDQVRVTYSPPVWTSRVSNYTATTNDILQASTYGGNQTNGNVYLLGSSGHGIKTSTNGITWVSRTAPFNVISAAAFGKGVWVIGGNTNTLASSSDSITWTSRNATIGGGNYVGIVYGNGLFVGVGNTGTVRTSTDGITWTTSSYAGSSVIQGIGYGNGTYVVVGGSSFISTSTDGITWTSRNSTFSSTVFDVAYGNGVFVAGGLGGALRTSTDGVTWVSRTSPTVSDIRKVAYIGTGFIGGTSNGGIVISSDGITWTTASASMGTTGITAITYGDGLVLLSGANGTLRTLRPSGAQLTQIYSAVTT